MTFLLNKLLEIEKLQKESSKSMLFRKYEPVNDSEYDNYLAERKSKYIHLLIACKTCKTKYWTSTPDVICNGCFKPMQFLDQKVTDKSSAKLLNQQKNKH